MFHLVCKTFPLLRPTFVISQSQELSYLQLYLFSTSPNKKEEIKRLFTINYLKTTCGFSQEKALSASKYLKFKSPEQPDSVISFFKGNGFSDTQVSDLISRCPTVLSCKAETTLLPKIEFFRSLGLSSKDMASMLSRAPLILKRSLRGQIIPSYQYISSFIQSPEKTLISMKRYCLILWVDLETVVIPNIEYLRKLGVPHGCIVSFLKNYPNAFSWKPQKFRELVGEVQSMGFNPVRGLFVWAVYALGVNTKSTWEKKMEIYRSWGLAEDKILEAFRKYPHCMTLSADKISKVMDFLVNEAGFEPFLVLRYPNIFAFSLDKRIAPRCLVYKALLAKDLLPENFTVGLLLQIPEDKFLRRFVKSFEAQVPGLLKMYKKGVPILT